ncbi:tyrosine-type recombinase/integrase [Methylicorpusculum oleiharenae]|uniref:site-specific integrase n=1 Tax=Methylicorpusculum oleiharenae TaxID=1338687 RepID=UPI00135A8A0D|nr:site-specific integrase [Methylicorpusculum oleiharenae]MCD2451090.1 tyrosine-type recombinase/integrase [Methylicorpusculum oleiharenae]MCD2452900.1 tyrosine-type recombinase/integrase [Methylicorpusculum oleiharenae]
MKSDHHTSNWLFDSQLAPFVDAFMLHLFDCRYASHTIDNYLAGLTHFAQWITESHIDVKTIDEKLIQHFLNDHLPSCCCEQPAFSYAKDLHAALGHLLKILRANAIIGDPSIGQTPVDEELRRFDGHMSHVRGLAATTRKQYLGIVRCLLLAQFADREVVIAEIKPNQIQQFIASQSTRCSVAASIGASVSALRGYFRYRATLGDAVHHLIGVTSFPANWQQASLPKTLTKHEVECLLSALTQDSLAALRTAAIVHCALDLGLRSSEVAYLSLDDIDWSAATITLHGTKGRREDVMPLPAATGQAIADYLTYERPPTSNRAVFVRNIAPRDQPIGPDLIRKSIRQAYARAGLPYTRSHLLRHTMASRLLESGSSLKEVADVLRHRSLNTTLVYAKLDSQNLATVALPWPGSAS